MMREEAKNKKGSTRRERLNMPYGEAPYDERRGKKQKGLTRRGRLNMTYGEPPYDKLEEMRGNQELRQLGGKLN